MVRLDSPVKEQGNISPKPITVCIYRGRHLRPFNSVSSTGTEDRTLQIGEKLIAAQNKDAGVMDMPDLFFCHNNNIEELGSDVVLDWHDIFTEEELNAMEQGEMDFYTDDGWYNFENETLKESWLKFAEAIAKGHIVVSDLYSNTQIMKTSKMVLKRLQKRRKRFSTFICRGKQ